MKLFFPRTLSLCPELSSLNLIVTILCIQLIETLNKTSKKFKREAICMAKTLSNISVPEQSTYVIKVVFVQTFHFAWISFWSILVKVSNIYNTLQDHSEYFDFCVRASKLSFKHDQSYVENYALLPCYRSGRGIGNKWIGIENLWNTNLELFTIW